MSSPISKLDLLILFFNFRKTFANDTAFSIIKKKKKRQAWGAKLKLFNEDVSSLNDVLQKQDLCHMLQYAVMDYKDCSTFRESLVIFMIFI